MTALALTRPTEPLSTGWYAPNGSLADRPLAQRLIGYRRQVASTYRAVSPAELSERLAPGGYTASPKVDGELWYLVAQGGQATLASPQGAALGGLPLLDEAATLAVAKAGESGRVILAGELFAAAGKGAGRPRVGDVSKCLADPTPAGPGRLGFMAFDLLEAPDLPEDYGKRMALVGELLGGGKRLRAAPTEQVGDFASLLRLYDTWSDNGRKGEGVVARDHLNRIYKIKPEFTVDCLVLGYTIRSDDPEALRSVALGVMLDADTVMHIGACGNFGDVDVRRALLRDLQGLDVDGDFRIPSSDGTLYRLIRPTRIFEVKATDVQGEDSSGEPIRQKIMRFDAAGGDGLWRGLGRLPGASLLHPVFVRKRDDKTVSFEELRSAQVEERTAVVRGAPSSIVRAASQVQRREVFVKDAKGQPAVRKLLVWRTNKDGDGTGEFPPYVVHWTDYSADRKDPLQRIVRPATSLEQATAIAEGLLAEGVKKGWARRENP